MPNPSPSPQLLSHRNSQISLGVFPPPSDLELIALVSRGETTEVWSAFDRTRQRRIAWKRLCPDGSDLTRGRRFLACEADALARVSSPYVARLLAIDADPEWPALRLEWLDGETVADTVAKGGSMDVARSLWIARQAAQGMHALLQAGLVHTRISADHIIVCNDGSAHLIDLSRAAADQATGSELSNREHLDDVPRLVSTGAESRCIERDLAALGEILFLMLTGRQITQRGPTEGVRTQCAREVALRVRQCAPQAPRELAGLIGELASREKLPRGSGLHWLIHRLIGMELQSIAGR